VEGEIPEAYRAARCAGTAATSARRLPVEPGVEDAAPVFPRIRTRTSTPARLRDESEPGLDADLVAGSTCPGTIRGGCDGTRRRARNGGEGDPRRSICCVATPLAQTIRSRGTLVARAAGGARLAGGCPPRGAVSSSPRGWRRGRAAREARARPFAAEREHLADQPVGAAHRRSDSAAPSTSGAPSTSQRPTAGVPIRCRRLAESDDSPRGANRAFRSFAVRVRSSR
jgi:hypothetical protein